MNVDVVLINVTVWWRSVGDTWSRPWSAEYARGRDRELHVQLELRLRHHWMPAIGAAFVQRALRCDCGVGHCRTTSCMMMTMMKPLLDVEMEIDSISISTLFVVQYGATTVAELLEQVSSLRAEGNSHVKTEPDNAILCYNRVRVARGSLC